MASVGNNLTPYARKHNEGVGNMPQRKFVGKSEKLEYELRGMVRQGYGNIIRDELDAAFGGKLIRDPRIKNR